MTIVYIVAHLSGNRSRYLLSGVLGCQVHSGTDPFVFLRMVEALKAKNRDYFDDSIMGALLEVLYAQKQAKYKGHWQRLFL